MGLAIEFAHWGAVKIWIDLNIFWGSFYFSFLFSLSKYWEKKLNANFLKVFKFEKMLCYSLGIFCFFFLEFVFFFKYSVYFFTTWNFILRINKNLEKKKFNQDICIFLRESVSFVMCLFTFTFRSLNAIMWVKNIYFSSGLV